MNLHFLRNNAVCIILLMLKCCSVRCEKPGVDAVLSTKDSSIKYFCGKLVYGDSAAAPSGKMALSLVYLCESSSSEVIQRLHQVVNDFNSSNLGAVACFPEHVRLAGSFPNIRLVVTRQNLNNSIPNKTTLFLPAKQFSDLLDLREDGRYDNVEVTLSLPPTEWLAFVSRLLIGSLAVGSILMGSLLSVMNLHQLLKQNEEMNKRLPRRYSGLLNSVIFLAVPTLLILTFFFFDVLVYFYIALFMVVGTLSIWEVFRYLTKQLLPQTEKLAVNLPAMLSKVLPARQLRFVPVILFLLAFSFTATWCVFRNDASVGWPMQCVIGFFIIAMILSKHLLISSARWATIFLLCFLAYDVFFVFITPLFVKLTTSAQPAESRNLDQLVRMRRFSDRSFMASVVTGNAGTVNELVPLVFRLRIQRHALCGVHQAFDVLLGFGDAAIPGLFCAFLAVYDACWKVPYRCQFWVTLLAYVFGLVISFTASYLTGMGQPALLYIVPCILPPPFVAAACVGGRAAVSRLWNGQLPYQSTETDFAQVNSAAVTVVDGFVGDNNSEKPAVNNMLALTDVKTVEDGGTVVLVAP